MIIYIGPANDLLFNCAMKVCQPVGDKKYIPKQENLKHAVGESMRGAGRWKLAREREGKELWAMFFLFQVVFIGLYFRIIAVLLKERINLHVIIYGIPKDYTFHGRKTINYTIGKFRSDTKYIFTFTK
jgi:hypothetical protein